MLDPTYGLGIPNLDQAWNSIGNSSIEIGNKSLYSVSAGFNRFWNFVGILQNLLCFRLRKENY